MVIAIKADEQMKNELLRKGVKTGVHIKWIKEDEALSEIEADAFIYLVFNAENTQENFKTLKPVFVNAVIDTCKELAENYVRINAWPGFLEREIVEIAGANELIKKETEEILVALGWRYVWVPDIPGMIAPRIISMIINEAYFALEDKISTKEEIDIAMKLGTNYPYGPFEWSKKIGLEKIYSLLKKLSEQDKRYSVATYLEQEALLII